MGNSKSTTAKEQNRWLLPLLCLYAFLFSGYYALSNPPFESPDEPAHLAYVNYVAQNHALPNQADPQTRVEGEGHQHPLYYVIAAALPVAYAPEDQVLVSAIPNADSTLAGGASVNMRAHLSVIFQTDESREAFYLLRLLNSFFVALTVLVVGLTARLYLRPDLQLLPPLFVAALPQLQFIGGSVSNDALTVLLAATVTYAAIKALTAPAAHRWVALGLWIGVAVLVKKSNLIFVPLGLALPFFLSRDAAAFKRAGIVAGCSALLILPLIIRNINLYGEILGTAMERETLSTLVKPKPLWSTYFVRGFPISVTRSFFAHFGWMNVSMPIILPIAFYLVAFVPVAFVRQQERLQGIVRQTLFCAIAMGLAIVALIAYNLTYEQPQGRLLFPALPAFALLWSVGMGRFTHWIRPVAAIFVLLDIACAVVNWQFYR